MIENLEDWVYSNYGKEIFHPGLERIEQALTDLKPELQKSKITIIAGTNGKGETTHRLGQALGRKSFCAWTSPHIFSITERFSSENGNIDKQELSKLLIESHLISKSKNYKLTYYEFLFFVFCRWVLSKKPDFLLLEVGLGGRLDAVNVLNADLVLLSSISRDHQEFLGQRYDQILYEKMGVIRPKTQIFSYLNLKYLDERAAAIAKKIGAQYQNLQVIFPYPDYEFSLRNQFLAYAAFKFLIGEELRPDLWRPSQQQLAFRGEIIMSRNEWTLFGSHNVDGVRKLIQFLRSTSYNSKRQSFNTVLTSFSNRDDEDVRVMLKMLKSSGLGEVVVTSFKHTKAYPEKDLEILAIQEGLRFVSDISSIVQGWTHQKILVVGSYYFLSALRPIFGHR